LVEEGEEAGGPDVKEYSNEQYEVVRRGFFVREMALLEERRGYSHMGDGYGGWALGSSSSTEVPKQKRHVETMGELWTYV
jgi:hypothetical protein